MYPRSLAAIKHYVEKCERSRVRKGIHCTARKLRYVSKITGCYKTLCGKRYFRASGLPRFEKNSLAKYERTDTKRRKLKLREKIDRSPKGKERLRMTYASATVTVKKRRMMCPCLQNTRAD